MKNDGKIGKEYVRKEIHEKQFPNLKIILPSLSDSAASFYLNMCAPGGASRRAKFCIRRKPGHLL